MPITSVNISRTDIFDSLGIDYFCFLFFSRQLSYGYVVHLHMQHAGAAESYQSSGRGKNEQASPGVRRRRRAFELCRAGKRCHCSNLRAYMMPMHVTKTGQENKENQEGRNPDSVQHIVHVVGQVVVALPLAGKQVVNITNASPPVPTAEQHMQSVSQSISQSVIPQKSKPLGSLTKFFNSGSSRSGLPSHRYMTKVLNFHTSSLTYTPTS